MPWFAFDPVFYRGTYPDLAHLTDAEAEKHYRDHGMAEGRLASAAGTRQTFLNDIGAADEVLEIGPFVSPLLTGPNVKYLDILSREQLVARAKAHALDMSRLPDEIHYVGELQAIDDDFDVVISSHSIEHQPDLVHHLQQVGRILRHGGRYFLMIPDKRYCFDHFIPESTIAGVLQAHLEKRTKHTLASVIEHLALNTHNDAVRHWNADHAELRPADQDARIDSAIELYDRQGGAYIDVHA